MQFRLALPLAAFAWAASNVAAVTTATFDNFSEGIYDTALNDPFSGIVVHHIVSLTQIASIDDALPDDGYLYASGNYLTTNGYVPGPGGALAPFSSLAIDLPATAQNASLDLIYANFDTARTVTLNGLNANGVVVATVSAEIPAAFLPFRDARLTIASLSRDIVSLSLVTNPNLESLGGFAGGIDNVTFDAVPEPATLSMIALLPLLMRRRRVG